MSANSDGLIDHILLRVALTSSQGLSAKDFANAVNEFHDVQKTNETPSNNVDDDDDIFLSTNPPSQALKIDSDYLETAWNWAVKHPDVSSREDSASTNGLGGDDVPVSSSTSAEDPHDQSGFLRAHARARFYTTQERIWYALTDHGVDWKRLPKLEFQCLSVIAAHGPSGILQPLVTEITGQDKRSVPKRTDALATKGYIIKESCLGGGTKTSVLRLKKFVKNNEVAAQFKITSFKESQGESLNMMRYDLFFDDMMRAMKKHNNMISFEDLRKELGVKGSIVQTRSLHRCVRRLVSVGLLRKLKALVHQDDLDEKYKKRNGSIKWARSLEMLRQPTELDRDAFMSNQKKIAGIRGQDRSDQSMLDAGKDDEDDDAADSDDDMTMLESAEQTNDIEEVGTRMEWGSHKHYSNMIFDAVDSSGPRGISSMELGKLATGSFFRRPFDEAMSKLTDLWQTSQPSHLRHLAIIRDTDTKGTVTHYKFRTFMNFQLAVAAGDAAWDYILADDDARHAIEKQPELDIWGFPVVRSSELYGCDGSASVIHCLHSLPSGSTEAKPYKARKRQQQGQKNRVKDRSGTPNTPVRAVAVIQEAEEASDADSSAVSKAAIQVPFNISDKRQEKELQEWQARTRKLAESRARLEALKAAVAIGTDEPPRKRGRPKSRKQTGDTNGTEVHDDSRTSNDPGAPQESNLRASPTSQSLTQTDTLSHSVSSPKENQPDPLVAPKGKKRKRKAEEDNLVVAESRIAALHEEILNQSGPGVYINPPGSNLLKAMNFATRGRPRNALIAVFKSSKLRDLDWFVPSSQPEAKPPLRRYKKSTPGTRNLQSPKVDRQASSEKATQLLLAENRNIQSPHSPTTRHEEPMVTSHANQMLDCSAVDVHMVDAENEVHDVATPAQVQTRISTQTGAELENSQDAHHDQEIPPVGSQAAITLAGAEQEAGQDPQEQMQVMGPPAPPVWQVDAGNTKTVTAQTSQETVAEAADHQVPPSPSPNREDLSVASVQGNRKPSSHPENDPRAASSHILNMTQARPSERALAGRYPTPRKVGLQRGGGIITHQRTKIVLDIVKQCGGVVSGDYELWFSFASVWTRIYKQQPDRKTLERILQSIIAGGRLKKITFMFNTRTGNVVKKHIVMEQGMDPSSPAVRSLQRNIQELYPAPYVPPEAPLSAQMRQRIDNHPANLNRNKERKALLSDYISNDTFPQDQSATVRQTKLQPITLGYTDKAVQASVAKRKQKLQAEEQGRKLRRLIRAGEVPDPDIEGASAFQLETYSHDPERVTVDRSQSGRKRITKRILLGPEKRKPRSAPLGSLRSVRDWRDVLRQPRRLLPLYSFENLGPADFDPSYDLHTVVSLTHGAQTFHAGTGTFGTDSSVVVSARLHLWERRVGLQSDFNTLMPQSMADIQSRLENDKARKSSKREYEGAAASLFDHEVDVVEQWEKKFTLDQIYDGFVCQPARFINHSTPTVFVEHSISKLDWSSVEAATLDIPGSGSFRVSAPQPVLKAHSRGQRRSILPKPRLGDYPEPEDTAMTDLLQHMDMRYGAVGVFSSSEPTSVGRIRATTPAIQCPLPSFQSLQGMLVPSHIDMDVAMREANDRGIKIQPKPPKPPKAPKQNTARRPFFTRPRRPRSRLQFPPAMETDVNRSMDSQDDKRLIMGVVVVRTLTGGLDQGVRSINWGFVHQVFRFKYDAKQCRDRWASIKGQHSVTVDKLQHRFRKLFVEAYERDEIPEIDLTSPEDIDWAEMVDWTDANLDGVDSSSLLRLPQTRDEFEEKLEVTMPEEIYEPDKEEFWVGLTTLQRREEMVNGYSYTTSHKPQAAADPLLLAKSWVRANVLTPDTDYNNDAAYRKIMTLTGPVLVRATEELLGDKVIRAENRGRTTPGRNYAIADTVLTLLSRPWDVRMLSAAARFKSHLDAQLRSTGKFEVSFHASDAEFLVMENLAAYGRVTAVPLLPDINHEFDAPFPKLSKWGFTQGNYKSVHMDRDRLQFRMELIPTEDYVYGSPTKNVVVPLEQQFLGELGPRLPFWTGIHGNFIRENWNLILVSVLFLLATRPGITAYGIAKTHKDKIWTWEVEMILAWAEATGLARKTDGENGGAWTAAEWWWMALAAH